MSSERALIPPSETRRLGIERGSFFWALHADEPSRFPSFVRFNFINENNIEFIGSDPRLTFLII